MGGELERTATGAERRRAETSAGGWLQPARSAWTTLRREYRKVQGATGVAMVPGELRVDGRRLWFCVSDNEDAAGPDGPGSPPIWAVNLHGYLGGGGMYGPESARLAEQLGWRVVNPSLPGFGASDPLGEGSVTMAALADQLTPVLEHLGAGPVVLLGHSMGGAVAVQYADAHPDATLGLIYRAGVATPAWQERRGLFPKVVGTVAPGAAPRVDVLAAIVLDTPDLLVGRMYQTVRSMWPDLRANLRGVTRTAPVASMLMASDLRPEVQRLTERGLPMLAEWGCLDRVTPSATAAEFAACSGVAVQWLPGGHSWMLARPQGQVDVLETLESGRRFLTAVVKRWRRHTEGAPAVPDRALQAIG